MVVGGGSLESELYHVYIIYIYICHVYPSGQIIATSHDLTSKGS